MTLQLIFIWLTACSDSKTSDSGTEQAPCSFGVNDQAPCIVDGYVWRRVSGESIAVFIEADAVDPQGYIDITVEDNNFYLYDMDGTLLIEDLLYCEDVEEGTDVVHCIYSFLPHQYPAVDTNNLDNYRVTAVIRDWSGNASEETALTIGEPN